MHFDMKDIQIIIYYDIIHNKESNKNKKKLKDLKKFPNKKNVKDISFASALSVISKYLNNA